jgi:hypothetical protein
MGEEGGDRMSLEKVDTDEGHYYTWDGNRVPGVSEVLSANDVILKNAFYEERAELAATRGRDVHLACADLDRGRPDWWTDDPELSGYVKAWILFKKDFDVKITEVETPHFHEVFRYAGEPDRYGQVRMGRGDFNVTIDLKATAAIGPHVPIQLGGYNLFTDDYEDRIPVAVQLKPNGKYNAHWYDKERGHFHQVFLSMLTVALWKNKAHSLGLYK